MGRVAHVMLLAAVLILTGCFDRTPTPPEPDPRPRSASATACPSADPADIAQDPFVRAQMQRAWNRSDPGTEDRREHGGWFTQHRGTDPESGETIYWTEYDERGPGSQRSLLLLPIPAASDDVRVVAHLHTHPTADPTTDSGWANPVDERFAEAAGVPGFIRYGYAGDHVVAYGPQSSLLTWDCPEEDDDDDEDALSFTGSCDQVRNDTVTVSNPMSGPVDYQVTGSPAPTADATGTLAVAQSAEVTVEIPVGNCSCDPYTAEGEITVGFDSGDESFSHRIATKIHYPARPDDDCGGTHGDPHLRTFDGLGYTFQAVGEFVLVEDPADPLGDEFAVHVRQAPWFSSRYVSVNQALGAAVAGDRVQFDSRDGGAIHVGGASVDLDDGDTLALAGGGTIGRDGTTYRLDWPSGEMLTVANLGGSRGSGSLTVTVAVPADRQTAGLLGTHDGDPTTDLRDRDGQIFAQPIDVDTLYGPFADAWRVTDVASLLPYLPGENTETFTDLTFPDRRMEVEDLSDEQLAAALAVCEPLGLDTRALQECLIDVAMTGDDFFAEVAASAPPANSSLEVVDEGDGRSDGGPPDQDAADPAQCLDADRGSVGDGRASSVTGAVADHVDIVEHCVTWNDQVLRFAARVADPLDPLTDDAWNGPDTRLQWLMEADGLQMRVNLFRIEDAMHATLTQAEEGRLCDMVDAGLRDGWFVATFPGDCLGEVASLSYAISFLYDLDPSALEKSEAPETILNDVVPGQDGMVGPIERGPTG